MYFCQTSVTHIHCTYFVPMSLANMLTYVAHTFKTKSVLALEIRFGLLLGTFDPIILGRKMKEESPECCF